MHLHTVAAGSGVLQMLRAADLEITTQLHQHSMPAASAAGSFMLLMLSAAAS
jgi:hypothetical protein